jgi:ABC-type nickel/cobalt efflux system permease component RcnA
MSALETSLIGVIAIGFMHGLEPGHGWPIALLYSVRTGRPTFYAFVSSGIISFFHFISSIAVVLVYFVASSFVNFTNPLLKYIAFAVLVVLAVKLLLEKADDQHGHFHDNAADMEHEHEHEHPETGLHTHMHCHTRRAVLSLRKIASCAFVLGFAHEEEFALLALAVGGISPLLLMSAYGLSVTVSLIAITVLGIKMYERVKVKVFRYEQYIPKVSALILLLLAISIILT